MSKYTLGSITVASFNDWDRVPREPGTIANIASWLAGGATTGAAFNIAYFTVSVGISVVTSWAISALSPRPDFGSLGSSGLLVNSLDAASPQDFVYGKVRKGGAVTFYESTGDTNKYLHQMIVIAAHEIEAIDEIYINDEIVTLDSDGFVTGDLWQSKIRLLYHLGDQTSTTDDFANAAGSTLASTLLTESELTDGDALDSNFVGKGLAYIYARYEYNQEVFANGLPLITAVVRGKKVYDPRTTSTAYSNNAALCIRDFISTSYGLNDNAIDDVVFAAAANECDEDVALAAGGTEKRYTINGVVRADRAIGDVLQSMTTACAGTLFWGSGYWKLKVGAYSAPVKTLTLDDLRSPINLDTRVSMRDNFNTVRGTFIDAEQDWISTDYPAIESATFKAEDGGDEVSLDLSLPYTTSAATAQRLAKMTLFRGREQMTLSADFGLNAFDIEVGDIVAFTNDRYGFNEKEFEVIGWKFAANQDAGDLRVTLTLRETSEAAFDWNAEESDIIGNNTNLPDVKAGLTISNLSVSQVTQITSDGTHTVYARASWDSAASAYVDHYEVQWRKTADTDYQSTTTSENSFDTGFLVDDVNYTLRVRAITQVGYRGEFSEVSFTASTDTTAPGVPTSVSGSGGFRSNFITWTNPTDADFKQVQVYVNTSNTTSGATLIGTTAGSEFTHSGLPESTTRYYWVKSVDFTGNVSGFSASTGAVTTLADPLDGTSGTDGATGDTVVTGKVYYQTLQSSSPGTPSASSYNVSTASFSGLTSGWSLAQPSVDITDTSVQEWSSNFTVTIDGVTSAQTIVFTSPSGAIQVTTDIESDNFVSGSSGWRIQRDTGDAEFGSAAIRGTLTANQIQVDGITLDSDGSGNLIVKSGGIGTLNVASRAITDQTSASFTSNTFTSSGSTTIGSFTTTESSQFILLNAVCNVYGSGTGTAYSLALTVDGSTVAIFNNSTYDDYATYNDLRFTAAAGAKVVVAGSGSHTIGLSYVIQSGSSIKVTYLDAVVTLLKR